MKTLIARLGMAALLGFPVLGAAENFIQSVTVVSVGLSQNGTAPSATVQVMLPNGQYLQGCAYSLLLLSDMTGEFQKQAYATMLTAKINGLQVSSIGYTVANNLCELTTFQL